MAASGALAVAASWVGGVEGSSNEKTASANEATPGVSL